MATISLNPEFEALLDGLGNTRLPNLALDYSDLLRNVRPDEDDVVGDIILSSTGLTAQFASLDPEDSEIYTFKISGSGITPSSTLQGLQQALENGTANGTITQISMDYGDLRIAQLDIAPESLTLSSGNQSLELTGGFPVTLSQLITLVDILDGEAEGSLEEYGFTGFSLRDNGEVLASLELGDTITLNLDGFVLTMTGADISVAELFEFINPVRAQIVPEITLFDASGNPVEGQVFSFSNDEPNSLRIVYEELPQGTYFAQVTASDEQIVSWQAQTGVYQLGGSWWGPTANANQWTFEDMGDAPANSTTPYVLNSGASFVGEIDRIGDADWVRIDFPGFNGTYSVSDWESNQFFTFKDPLVLDAFGTGQPATELRDVPGISFDSLTITDPDGTVILSATDVENFRNFIDELDVVLGSFFIPSLGDLSLAFATGDPHLLTHDGLGYDFHAAGEYVLMRATNGEMFELQSRMSPAGENVTANVAAALQLGEDTIMIAPGATQLRINGDARALADGDLIRLDTSVITREGNSYKIYAIAPDDSQSLIQVDIVGSRVDIGVGLSSYWQNNVEGLLGNFNGTIDDDLVFDGGTKSLQIPLQFGDDAEAGTYGVYGEFRDYWRVNDETTLFTYSAGEGPDSFYLADYPTQMITLDDFSPEARAEAGALAEAAGLTPGSFAFNNAVLDLLVTQDESYLESATRSQEFVQTVTSPEAPAPEIVTPEVAGGGLTDTLLSLSGSISSFGGAALTNTTVTFRPDGKSVNLTRQTRDSDSFEFNLSENSEGRLDASRDWQTGDPSITALDALNVLRIAVGVAPSFGEASAQQLIAADINGDGRVTALDALEVLRAAVGVSSANAPRWVFFDAETDWDALELSRENTLVETGVSVASLTENTGGVDMVGILLGNMDTV